MRNANFAKLVCAAGMLILVAIPASYAQAPAAGQNSRPKSATGLSSLPASAQGPVSAALGRGDSGYWLRSREEGIHGQNPQQALAVKFTKQGVEVRSHNLRWRMKMRGYGYGHVLRPLKAVAPQSNANRVEYRRDGVTEWYENGPLGLEQGFTLSHPPAKSTGQPLTLELSQHGDLSPALGKEGKSLELKGKDGRAELRYAGLKATDADGRELHSWLELSGDRLRLRVNDAAAKYPVTVDPWTQEQELTLTNGSASDYFGSSVAIDGGTMIVGAYGQEAAYIFGLSGDTWTQQAKLTASDGTAGNGFGWSVAISGSTAIVGAPFQTVGTNIQQGEAYVFVQSGTAWPQQAKLIASDGNALDLFGRSVAISSGTAVVGSPDHKVGSNINQGEAYVFTQSGETWPQQDKLTAANGSLGATFGYSVAISGGTIVVGAPSQAVGTVIPVLQGAAYVFAPSGETWSQQAELVASDGANYDAFGQSVAMSGSTLVVADPHHPATAPDQYGPGEAYVFMQSGTAWSQQTEIAASDGAAGDEFGWSIALDGGTAIVGAPFRNNLQGSVYVLAQDGSTWTQQELTASDGAIPDLFGSSVAISGTTALAGAPDHAVGLNATEGAAYVFSSSSSPTTVTLSPKSLTFADQAIDTTSASKTVTLTNTGTATLDITSITASTGFAISSNTCGSTVDAGKKCTVKVTFTPTAIGAATGTLNFTDNASGSPQTVSLSGTGEAQAALTPSTHTFPKTKVGNTSAAYKFTLKNNLPTTLAGISYSTKAPFAVSTSTCSTTLESKKSCTISVTFAPTSDETFNGTLTVNDSANGSPQTASLSGTGD